MRLRRRRVPSTTTIELAWTTGVSKAVPVALLVAGDIREVERWMDAIPAFRVKAPDLFDAIRVDGVLHRVTSIEWEASWGPDAAGEAQSEPLADIFARNLTVGDLAEPLTLGDLMIEAGWTPPA